MSSGTKKPRLLPDRVVVLLSTTPPFDRLPGDHLEQVIADCLVEYFAPEETIFEAGSPTDHLYVVESGCVRLVEQNTQRLVDLCGEGDTFGADGLLGKGAPRYRAVAAEPSVCALIPAARFRSLCSAARVFADFFAGVLQRHAQPVETAMDTVGARLLFSTPVSALLHRPPLTCPPSATVREAALRMRSAGVGSILAVDGTVTVGILTDADLRNNVVAAGLSFETAVGEIMSAPVASVGRDALVFDALMEMSKHRIHHLAITSTADPASPLAGVISDKDISHASGNSPAVTIKRIENARSIRELARVRSEADGHLLRLSGQGVQPEDLMDVVAEINDRLTVRILDLARDSVIADLEQEDPGVRWTWLALGSKGRREMGLRGDQDNALLYEDTPDRAVAERAETWFRAIAQRVSLGLAECGFALCRGGVMAVNSKWRQPLSQWRRIFGAWILEPEPKALMHSSIFFDLRALYGSVELADRLKADLGDLLRRERGFLAFLAHNALSNRPPLSFFRHFVVDRSGEYRNTFNVKLHGLMPLVDLARLLALEGHFLASTNTFDRLTHAGKRLANAGRLTAGAADAFRYLLDLRLQHHLQLLEEGKTPNDRIDPSRLSKTQQQMLRAVFSTMADMQTSLAHRYGAHLMRW